MKQAIINSAFLSNKEQVHLDCKDLREAGFNFLLTKETRKLAKIYLKKNQLSPLSILRMREAKWDALTQLFLGQNIVGDKGCQYLSRVCIPRIQIIDLSNNYLSSLGMFHLVKAEWKNLRQIGLSSNRIGVDGVKRFSSAKWGKQLNSIGLSSNELSVDQVYQLAFCEVKQYLTVHADCNDNVEACYKEMVRSILKLKLIQIFSQWY